jgi:hypothetical protein
MRIIDPAAGRSGVEKRRRRCAEPGQPSSGSASPNRNVISAVSRSGLQLSTQLSVKLTRPRKLHASQRILELAVESLLHGRL